MKRFSLDKLPTKTDIDVERAHRHILDFVPHIFPGYKRPNHLAPLTSRVEAAFDGTSKPLRLIVATPPRHGKTETLLAASVFMMTKRKWGVVYVTHSQDLALEKSMLAQRLAEEFGCEFTKKTAASWALKNGSTFFAAGVGGGLTGRGLDFGIIDDPVKDRQQAESPTYRKRADDYFRDVFRTRLAPKAHILVNMARWHHQDLSGLLVKRGYEYLNLPALAPGPFGDKALWPEQWPTEALLDIKTDIGAYSFEGLYQGAPRPRGGSVFGDCYLYDMATRPLKFRVAIGVDLAYSKKTSADWSVAVVMAEAGGYYYVLDVVRAQVRAPQFMELLKQLQRRYPTARTRWYAAGTEEGAADFIRDSKVRLQTMRPMGDKFIRAQPYAAAWNANRVLVPDAQEASEITAAWVNPFLDEHASFTGVSDVHDDQIDAAGTAFDVLHETGPTYEGIPERSAGEPDARKEGEGGRRRM